MDNIREWISDNLRYILLGVALLLVLAVAVFGIRAISNIANGKTGTTQTEKQTEASTAADNDVIVETNSAAAETSSLVEDDAKILTTMTSYYSARTNNDTATLQKLDPSYDANASTTSAYVESYSDVKTYSRQNTADGGYLVYVCYNAKVTDIDTLVPSLAQFYLKENESGSLYIADTDGDTQAEKFIEENRASSEVQKLIEEVNAKCEAAQNSDPALKEFMEKHGATQSAAAEETEASTGNILVANDECNIRAESNTDSEVLGVLYIGETVTKTGETDDGWTQIDYNGTTAYVKSEFLSAQSTDSSEEETESTEEAAADNGDDANSDGEAAQ